MLSDALRGSGSVAEAAKVSETAKEMAIASRTLNWFGGAARFLGTGQPPGALLPGLDSSGVQTAVPLGAPASAKK